MAIVTGLASMPVAKLGGKMVRVPMGRKGVFVLMEEGEARAKGLIPADSRQHAVAADSGEQKSRTPARNKARKAEEDK